MMSANSDESATRASVTCAAVVDGASTSDGVADNSTGDVSEGCRIDDPSRNDNTRVCGDGGIILHKNTSFCHEGGKAGEDGISAPQTNVNTGEYDDGSVVFKLGQVCFDNSLHNFGDGREFVVWGGFFFFYL